jgi:hypothetical protein
VVWQSEMHMPCQLYAAVEKVPEVADLPVLAREASPGNEAPRNHIARLSDYSQAVPGDLGELKPRRFVVAADPIDCRAFDGHHKGA